MANFVHSARRGAVRLAHAEPMAPDVRSLGERPTVASMVRRRLFPERRIEVAKPGWTVRKLHRAS